MDCPFLQNPIHPIHHDRITNSLFVWGARAINSRFIVCKFANMQFIWQAAAILGAHCAAALSPSYLPTSKFTFFGGRQRASARLCWWHCPWCTMVIERFSIVRLTRGTTLVNPAYARHHNRRLDNFTWDHSGHRPSIQMLVLSMVCWARPPVVSISGSHVYLTFAALTYRHNRSRGFRAFKNVHLIWFELADA